MLGQVKLISRLLVLNIILVMLVTLPLTLLDLLQLHVRLYQMHS